MPHTLTLSYMQQAEHRGNRTKERQIIIIEKHPSCVPTGIYKSRKEEQIIHIGKKIAHECNRYSSHKYKMFWTFITKQHLLLSSSICNPSGTQKPMLQSQGGLLKATEHKGQQRGKECWQIYWNQHTNTHSHTYTHTNLSCGWSFHNDRFTFRGQVSEQEGIRTGGAE